MAEDDRRRTASTPIVVFAHIPLWQVYPAWLGTETRRAPSTISSASGR
jgi:hypothetical protein